MAVESVEIEEDCGVCTLDDTGDGAGLAGCDPSWNAGSCCCSLASLLMLVDSVDLVAEESV